MRGPGVAESRCTLKTVPVTLWRQSVTSVLPVRRGVRYDYALDSAFIYDIMCGTSVSRELADPVQLQRVRRYYCIKRKFPARADHPSRDMGFTAAPVPRDRYADSCN